MDGCKPKGTIVFFSMDALGHIHPILSIAKELRRRGYRAIILTTRPLSMAPRLQAMGFELEYCQDQLADTGAEHEDKLKTIMIPLMNIFRKGPKSAFEGAYALSHLSAVNQHLEDMITNHDIIEAKLKSLKPDLVMFDHIIGVPCMTKVAPRWVRTYSGYPIVLYSSYNDNCVGGLGLKIEEMTPEMKQLELSTKLPLRDRLRRFFAEKGCPDWPRDLDFTPTSPHLNFYLGPEELGLEKVPSFKPLPDVWFRLEHTIDDDDATSRFEIPESIAKCPGKLIYFSLGTLVTSDVDLINRLMRILSKSPNKFIISKGAMHEHIKLFPNMWGEKFVDQKAILPKVDLFITHGGHNSIIESFYYGVPGLIVLPVFADQFDNAQRVEDCGFGIRLSPYECSEKQLLESIDSLLANEELKARMQAIGSRLRSIKYHKVAADKLEELLRVV